MGQATTFADEQTMQIGSGLIGGPGDGDIFGCQQYPPLFDIEVPAALGEDLVCLEGSPAAVGEAFGTANAADIRAGVQAFFSGEHDRDAILRATQHHRSLVGRYAPYWFDETADRDGLAVMHRAQMTWPVRGLNATARIPPWMLAASPAVL